MMYSPSGVDNTLRWTTKYQNLWKTEASLLRSQEPATVPYQMNPINTIQTYFPNVQFNIIPLSPPMYSDGFFPSDSPTIILYAIPMSTMRTACNPYILHETFSEKYNL